MSGLFVVLTSLVVSLDFGGLPGWFGSYAVSKVTGSEYGITETNEAEYGRKTYDTENNTTYNKTINFAENIKLPIPDSQNTSYTAAAPVNTFEYNDISYTTPNNSSTSYLKHILNPPPVSEQIVPVVEDDTRTREHNGTQNNASESDATVSTDDAPYKWDFSTREMVSDSENILETTNESGRSTTVYKETVDVQKEQPSKTSNATKDNIKVNGDKKSNIKSTTDTIFTTESLLIFQTTSEKSKVNIPESQTACKISRGWNLRGTDWGCCGNYDDCCTYASLFCYIHDAICKCCDIRNNLCGPLCKPEPDCKGTMVFDGKTQREVEESNSDSFRDGSGEIEDIMPPKE